MKKSVVVISDLHVGSKRAVMPESFTLKDGQTILPNRAQLALFKAWREVTTEWKKPDILVVNGEPIDGQQKKNEGVDVWTTDYFEQIRAAVRLCRMFNAKNIYVTQGSNYHVEIGGVSVEEMFGSDVDAQEVDGVHVKEELFLDVCDVIFNFAHHISGSMSGWMYRSTPPAKEMMLAKLNAGHKYDARVLVRSHNHYYWFVGSGSHLALCTPAWQLQNWFGMRHTSWGSIPDIGAVRFEVEDGEYKWEAKIFRLPEFRPTKVVA